MVAGVVLDVALHGALAVGAIAQDGPGDEVPAEGLGQQVGGVLAQVQGAGGEVPQGHLALAGFVDGLDLLALGVLQGDMEGVVGAEGRQVAGDGLAALKDRFIGP